MSDEQSSAADSATGEAVDAHLTKGPEAAAPLFNRATIEHSRSAQESEKGQDQGWRDGQDAQPLSPMPAAPAVTSETDAAINKLNTFGGAHADLLASWGPDAAVNVEYARSAFRDVAASNPDLIAKFDANGLGDHPAVLDFLAKHGRLSAGMMGDLTIARRNNDMPPISRNQFTASGQNRAGGSAQAELKQLMLDNPPGSESYKNPQVQRRAENLSRLIAGRGDVVGKGGRTA
jgi:hypothetical protein